MDSGTGKLVSEFIAERVDIPDSREIDVWTQFVYAALFSAGFAAWIMEEKDFSSQPAFQSEVDRFIAEIATDAERWINAKVFDSLGTDGKNIHIDHIAEIEFHLGAMFQEAFTVVAERGFAPESARSHACFVHLSRNLEQLCVVGQLSIDSYKGVLEQGIEGCDAMTAELAQVLSAKYSQQRIRTRLEGTEQ